MSFQILCPFLTGLSVLLLLSCKRFLYFGYKSLIRYMTDKYFPPVCGLPFYFLVVFFEKLSIKELMLLNYGVGEDSWESLGQQGFQPVHPKGNQSWIFSGRTDAEDDWPPDVKNWLTGKDPHAGKDWRQEEKETEDEMVEWHDQLNEHEYKQILGDTEGQGSLMCCSPWDHKESDSTEWLNSNIFSGVLL